MSHLTPWLPLPETISDLPTLIRELNRRLAQREVFWRTVMALPTRTVTAAVTLRGDDTHVRADASGGAFTVTLPRADQSQGFLYIVTRVNSGANAVTVGRTGSDTISGATSVVLGSQWESLIVQANGASSWDVLARPATLDDLLDVVITSATTNDLLRFDGTNWVNTSKVTATSAGELALAADAITGSGANATVTITRTYNTTGAPHAVTIVITNTASDSAATFMRFLEGANERFWFGVKGELGVHPETTSQIPFHTAILTTDTFSRWLMRYDGKQEWGDGANPLDTNLYRNAANELATDDAFRHKAQAIFDVDVGARFNNHTNGAAAAAGTLTNAPTAGDPAFWLPVSIAGTTRYIPCW
jgi:hypothetical protein